MAVARAVARASVVARAAHRQAYRAISTSHADEHFGLEYHASLPAVAAPPQEGEPALVLTEGSEYVAGALRFQSNSRTNKQMEEWCNTGKATVAYYAERKQQLLHDVAPSQCVAFAARYLPPILTSSHMHALELASTIPPQSSYNRNASSGARKAEGSLIKVCLRLWSKR